MFRRKEVLSTPPTPNAGTIRAILAMVLIKYARRTMESRSWKGIWRLLYMFKPSRCMGVLKN
jgi:hypothetical protein